MVSVPDLDFREPYSNEPEFEDSLHLTQIVLLLTCLEWWWRDRQDFFVAGNLSIYYPRPKPFSRRFTGPDFFVALDTVRRPRRSWVVENEGKYPNLIVEILSSSTAKRGQLRCAERQRTAKKTLYQDVFQTPEYFWFYPRSKKLEFKGFQLQNGEYVEITPTAQGWRWSEQLSLFIGVVDGNLRYFTADGMMIPNFEEATEQERQRAELEAQRAELESQRAEQERQRAEAEAAIAQQQQAEIDRLRQILRDRGIDPDLQP